MSLTIEGKFPPSPIIEPSIALDALRCTPVIFPQLEELDARIKFDESDCDKMRQVFRDLVCVRKGVINRICVPAMLGDELIKFLKDNITCVVVAQPDLGSTAAHPLIALPVSQIHEVGSGGFCDQYPQF